MKQSLSLFQPRILPFTEDCLILTGQHTNLKTIVQEDANIKHLTLIIVNGTDLVLIIRFEYYMIDYLLKEYAEILINFDLYSFSMKLKIYFVSFSLSSPVFDLLFPSRIMLQHYECVH